MTEEIVIRVRIEPDEVRPPQDGREDAPEEVEVLILDGDNPTLEEAGYGHGV